MATGMPLVEAADAQKPAYQALFEILSQISQVNPDIAYIYTMRQGPDGEIVFIMDPSEENSHPGEDVYEDPSPLLSTSFATLNEPIVEEDFYTDEWGTWLSGYAPIYRSNGQREGILGMDIAASEVLAQERRLLRMAGDLRGGPPPGCRPGTVPGLPDQQAGR
jgi:methyl-accepting chemotaxis protein